MLCCSVISSIRNSHLVRQQFKPLTSRWRTSGKTKKEDRRTKRKPTLHPNPGRVGSRCSFVVAGFWTLWWNYCEEQTQQKQRWWDWNRNRARPETHTHSLVARVSMLVSKPAGPKMATEAACCHIETDFQQRKRTDSHREKLTECQGRKEKEKNSQTDRQRWKQSFFDRETVRQTERN